jgi:hypothetical protein
MSTRRVESFLIRIVVSKDATQNPDCWRGRIQHIATGEELQIDELAQAIAFITTHLAPLTDYILAIEEDQPVGP